jgi:hypothetical protein
MIIRIFPDPNPLLLWANTLKKETATSPSWYSGWYIADILTVRTWHLSPLVCKCLNSTSWLKGFSKVQKSTQTMDISFDWWWDNLCVHEVFESINFLGTTVLLKNRITLK